jgi:hypothetical protein
MLKLESWGSNSCPPNSRHVFLSMGHIRQLIYVKLCRASTMKFFPFEYLTESPSTSPLIYKNSI